MAYDFSKGAATAGQLAKAGGAIGGPLGAAIGGGIGLLFGFGKSKPSPQEIAAEKYYNELLSIGLPPKEALRTMYQRYQSAGELTPEMEESFMQADTRLNEIESDPQLREAQTNVLDTLKREAEQQGLTLEDRIAMTEGQLSAETEAKGRQDAIMQNLAARGQAGAGQELAARMMAEQSGAQREALRSATVASEARKRALQAVMSRGDVAGNIRNQDFSEAARKAEAQDAINRFNTSNRQDVSSRNVAAKNLANRLNLENEQNRMNMNTGLSNREVDANVQLEKDYNAMSRGAAADKYNALTGKNTARDAADARSSTGFVNTIKGVGETVGSMYDKDGNFKKNPFSIDKEEK